MLQDAWLEEAIQSLFNDTVLYHILLTDRALAKERNATLPYSQEICPYSNPMCLVSLAMGQNLFDMFLKIKIQGKTVDGNVFWNSYAYI